MPDSRPSRPSAPMAATPLRPSIAVIGRGLIGSAAARHLASHGLSTTLIGPSEPADKRTHHGVFASHYDEGRISRKLATHPFWAEVSRASIARYAAIERHSGIGFFRPVGSMMLGAEGGSYLSAARKTAAELSIPHRALEAPALAEQFPDLACPPDHAALWEPTDAGHLSPRRLVAAQTAIAKARGARVIDATVEAVEDTAKGVRVRIPSETLRFDRVLIAAGGMTDHLLGRTPRLRVLARTIALFWLADTEARRLSYLPSIVTPDHYFLPPVRYPNGKPALKLGGDPKDLPLRDPQDIGDWFRAGGNASVRDGLIARFHDLLPSAEVEHITMDACMTTWTDESLPEIRALSPRMAVATAGNGAGAKCSDELGLRGARLVAEEFSERMHT